LLNGLTQEDVAVERKDHSFPSPFALPLHI